MSKSDNSTGRDELTHTGSAHTPPQWWGALIGLVALGVGLAAGEVVAGLSRVLHPPIVSVGDRVIDRVPKSVKQWAIRTFGTSDKTVLVWSIAIVLAIAAVLVGIAVVRGRREIGIGFAILFGLLGAWAAGVGRNTRFIGVFPSLIAAAVASGVLMLGHQLSQPRTPHTSRPAATPTHHGPSKNAAQSMTAPPVVDRRRFLMSTGGLALSAVALAAIGRGLQDRFDSALVRAGVRLPTPKEPLPAPPLFLSWTCPSRLGDGHHPRRAQP